MMGSYKRKQVNELSFNTYSKLTVCDDDRVFSRNSFIRHRFGEVDSQEHRVVEVTRSVWRFEKNFLMTLAK
jgi:hypothetical protein